MDDIVSCKFYLKHYQIFIMSCFLTRCVSPGTETDSEVVTPRIDTSSLSFLESLEYDPMEGPSWLFESLKKKTKRKSGT